VAQDNTVGDALLGAVASVGGAVGQAIGDLFRADDQLGSTPASGQHFKVNKDTVLASGKIINDQIVILTKAYDKAYEKLRVNLEGADEVNASIAGAWNSRLVDAPDSYAKRVTQYIVSLTNLVEQLRTSAEQYGFDDDEISTSLGVRS